MLSIINSTEETEKRIYKFPTSQVKLNGKKSSYFEVINSLQFDECNKALKIVMDRLNIDSIAKLIDETPLITDVQKLFYKHMINARYNTILYSSYIQLHS